MNLSRTRLAILVLAVWLIGEPVWGEAWSLSKLNPLSGSNKSSNTHKVSSSRQSPSMWQKMNHGTKEFFGKVGDAITPDKPAPKKSARTQSSWTKSSKNSRKKSSWFSSWFGPKEPEPPRSLDEWMALEPIRP